MSEKEIVKVGTTPATLLELAVEKGADVDKLEKLMELKMRWDANEAKKAFNSSMVLAQGEMPVVPKDKKNTQTNSMYAKYETILKYTKPIYTKHGFSLVYSEGEAKRDDEIRIVVDIMHREGHTEQRFTDIPLDMTGIKGTVNKTKTHGKGSSITYGKGYLIKMVFNIPTGDDDNGNAAGAEYITEDQAFNINNLISEKKLDESKILKFARAESVDKILKSEHKRVLDAVMKAKVKNDNN